MTEATTTLTRAEEQGFLQDFGSNLSGLAKTHDQNNRTQSQRAQA